MTENEAKEWLRKIQNPMISEAELYCAETCYGLGKMVYPEPEDYVFETAIQALEEIQQYRAIGTVEEFKDLKEKSVAKIPIRQPNHDMTYEEVLCPRCKRYVSKYTNPYCECGQKLGWQ